MLSHLGAGKVGEGVEELGQGVGQEVDGLELQLVTHGEGPRAGNKLGQSSSVVSQYLVRMKGQSVGEERKLSRVRLGRVRESLLVSSMLEC